MSTIVNKQYLGDSVYLEYDGVDIILTTNNGFGASNTIVLDPSVTENLFSFIKALKNKDAT